MEHERRTLEEYEPAVEWSHAADVDTVTILCPGFKRQELRVLVDNHLHMRVRGERPVAEGSAKWMRLQTTFVLPDNCDLDGIRSKFEKETLTVTLPKTSRPSPPDGSDPTTLDDQGNKEEEEKEKKGTVVEEEKPPEEEASGKRPIRWLLVAVAGVLFVGITAYAVWRKLRSGGATGVGDHVPGELAGGAGSYVSEM
ncbi:hypothetical protein HU200_044256 [Digitaria exilis]|uniref:SHSP domain-containing protein n=1 Tax=Digitaria exilis TaxID=1010633 RepID=A0A835EBA1_9POAL|nr:hypothetical protein HU200_044256 [Digitaria exilis]